METEILERIENSRSLRELQEAAVLPDPFDDTGFYYIYYAKEDYKTALCDIVRFAGNGLRVYYNRYLDTGKSFTSDYLAKAKSVHCRCAVIYLSENALRDPVFFRLLRTISAGHIAYLSINLPAGGTILSGEQMAARVPLSEENAAAVRTLFGNEITYLPYNMPFLQKKRELERVRRISDMHYSLHKDFAVADYVNDTGEETVDVLPAVLIGGKEYPVKAVRRGAFAHCEQLKKITLPDTLLYIGFTGSEPDALPSSGDRFVAGTFFGCENLEEIVFPPHVRFLYPFEFCGCTGLKRLLLNPDLRLRATDAYAGSGFFLFENPYAETETAEQGEEAEGVCLDEIRLPQSVCFANDEFSARCLVTQNGDRFDYWQTIDVPAKKITGYSAVRTQDCYVVARNAVNGSRCMQPRHLAYEEGWNLSDTIGDDYADCERLLSAELPDGVLHLQDTFRHCGALTTVKLPRSLQTLVGTFEDCSSLETIELPDGLWSVGGSAFARTALTEIRLPETVIKVDDEAFDGCERLRTIVSDSKFNKWLFKKKINMVHRKLMYRSRFVYFLCAFFGSIFGFFRNLHRLPALLSVLKNKLRFFEGIGIETIYLKKGTGKFKIKGFTRVPSDRDGYIRYTAKEPQ